ncbi:hypothetical protein ACEXS9_003102 [Salmonella enterica]
MIMPCSITVITKDNKFKTVYCYFDGFPENAGKMLAVHYNSQEKAEALIAGGDILILGERCDRPEHHSFEDTFKNYTIYYNNGRDKENNRARYYIIFSHILNEENCNYNYVFDGKKWGCVKMPHNKYIALDDYCSD